MRFIINADLNSLKLVPVFSSNIKVLAETEFQKLG